MRKDIIFIIAVLTFSVSTAQVDIKQVGYHKVIVADTVYSQHSQDYQAQETQLNLEFQGIESKIIPAEKVVTIRPDFWDNMTPDTVYVETLEYVYDTIYLEGDTETRYVDMIQVNGKDYKVSEIEYMLPQTEVDTIDVTECWNEVDSKTWRWDTPEHVWIPFEEIGFSHVKVDSMPIWKKKFQRKYRLQRTKHHDLAKTEYEELEMPFQFMYDSIVSIESNVARVRVFANEDWYPTTYVEDQLWEELIDSTPGYQDFDGFETRRHTITFNGLLPDTSYTLKVVGRSRLRKEETSVVYFNIKTSQ